MSAAKRLPTSAEVFAVLRARHHTDMTIFSSYSDPTGTTFGRDGTQGRMDTEYGLALSDFPLMGASTTWMIDPAQPHRRIDEKTEYWLCAPQIA